MADKTLACSVTGGFIRQQMQLQGCGMACVKTRSRIYDLRTIERALNPEDCGLYQVVSQPVVTSCCKI